MKTLWAVGALLLLVLAYLLNLGSLYAPTNGDEMVYLHIARLTSESGHWLPLVSDLQTPAGGEMRNTKPPLLFWQAMFAGQWGWDLFTLRLPYVLQTLACSLVVAWLTKRLVGEASQLCAIRARPVDSKESTSVVARACAKVRISLVAATIYLGFFSTYRYGRPVLSSSIESLFLFGICTLFITQKSAWRAYPVRLSAVAGVLMMPALLSKSFVLAAPVGLWLLMSLWVLDDAKSSLQKLWRSVWPAGLAVAIGLAGFSLWFAVDPHPTAVWREFVIGENFSTKFNHQSDSILTFWLSPLFNAGILFPLVIGLVIAALQAMRNKASQPFVSEKLLWLWVLCWMLVFTLPSQRSARYVIPIMPALAVLIVLYAGRIHRVWWMLTFSLIAVATASLGWIAWCLDGVFAVGSGFSGFYFVALALLLMVCSIGLLKAAWRMACTAIASLAWLVMLGALAAPFDAPDNQYSAAIKAQFAGQTILVPQNFNAQSERFTFILPSSRPVPYDVAQGLPASFAKGEVLASRLVLRSRHADGEVSWDALSSKEGVQRLLVEREVLVSTKK